MPIYHKLGKFPEKRHTQFEKPDFGGLYYEQLFGTIGFEGMSSLMYHIHRPTQVREILSSKDVSPKIAVEKNIQARLLKGFQVPSVSDYLDSRIPLLINNDIHISLAAPQTSLTSYFFKNADADEMIFVHRGTGTLRTQLGNIRFVPGDYLIIPRGMIYQIEFDNSDIGHLTLDVGNISEVQDLKSNVQRPTSNVRLLVAESYHPIYTPKRYRNMFGQLLEHSPYCERDIKLPENLETHDEKGDFIIKIKKQGVLYEMLYPTHPFDVVGWDGYNFPYGFSIHNFEPITGRVHQPPTVHQTFETKAFVVCSFVPRLYDYHPKAIPAPYNHSNIDSDEMIYYVDGDFMSRNNIEQGHITLHPSGIPHGPAPGAYERSIGKKETVELAVMIDTFRPLMLTEAALKIDDGIYYKSWVE